MTWDNKQRRLNNAIQYSQVAGSIMWSDGQPVIKWEPLAQLLTEESWYDFDKMTQKQASSQSWEDVINELKQRGNWIDTSWTNPGSPNFIPPEQRSWAAKAVSTISWQAKISAEELIAE